MVTGSMLLVIFVLAIALLLLAIIKFKVNPFLALLGVSILTGLAVRMPLLEVSGNIAKGFGSTLQGVGIVIGLGIILGQILSESKAINAIATGMLKLVGNSRANLALTISGWLISIPVFQDAAFVIFMPLVRQIKKATKKPLVALVCSLGVGTITAHALVIPTPGPVAVAGNMNINIGAFLFYSLIVSLPAVLIAGVLYSKWLEKKAIADGSDEFYSNKEEFHIDTVVETDNAKLPSMSLSLFVLLFPLAMIFVGSIAALLLPKESTIRPLFAFFGDKNIALFVGVLVAIWALKGYFTKSTNEIITEATLSAGLIFLITGAGGGFGTIINASGIGKYLVDTLSSMNISLIVLGFILSQVLRAAQGSTTVALVTTSSILGPLVGGTGVSPVLVGLAICAGGIGVSLPNDSGFWVLSNYSGLTVKDTIKAWTVGGTIAGVSSFVFILILSLIPGLPGLY